MIDDKTREILEEASRTLGRDGFEGCAFLLPSGSAATFTMTTSRVHGCRYNIGRQVLYNRMQEALGDERADVGEWFNALRRFIPEHAQRPATLWHRPELIVSEVMSPERLITTFEVPERWWPERMREIADQIGVYNVEDLDRVFRQLTRRELRDSARRYFERSIERNEQ